MQIIALLLSVCGISKLLTFWSEDFHIELIQQSFTRLNLTPKFIKNCLIFEAILESLCGLYILFL